MLSTWIINDESMLYPTDLPAISYFFFEKDGKPIQYKMVLLIDKPTDPNELKSIQELAESEVTSITGMWSGEIVDLVDRGNITFDLVFASELIDARKIKEALDQDGTCPLCLGSGKHDLDSELPCPHCNGKGRV